MRKTTLSLTVLLTISSVVCTKEQDYDVCMDEVAAQTAVQKEDLANLTCEDLLSKLSLPIPKDYVTLKEKNAVVFAPCFLTEYGDFRLQQNQFCYENIKDFLGIQPITQCLMEALSVEGDLQELEAEYVSQGAAGCMIIRSRWSGEKKECQKPKEEKVNEYSCAPHEPTHIFVAGTVLHRDPPWLNEGLADYVSVQLRENETLECFAGSFRYTFKDNYTGELKEMKEGSYVPLDMEREEHRQQGTSFDAYLTGACLWDYIDSNYGHETFKAIMQDVNASRFASMSFVNNILQYHIGENGINDLKNKFGDDSIEVFE